MENWNRFNANTGGTLVEKCCHFFDLMRLFAAADPVRVMASGAIDLNHKDEIYNGKVFNLKATNLSETLQMSGRERGACRYAESYEKEEGINLEELASSNV